MVKQRRVSAPLASSFYFSDEDHRLLEYCVENSGLSQSELLRRLIRSYAAGSDLPGMVQIPSDKSAADWLKHITPKAAR